MAYYESSQDENYYDAYEDDYGDTQVEAYDDAQDEGEGYDDAFDEAYDDAYDEAGGKRRRRARSRRRRPPVRRRRGSPSPPRKAMPAVVKPKEVQTAFNRVSKDVGGLKEKATLANDNLILELLSRFVNTPQLETQNVHIDVLDENGTKIPKDIRVAIGINNKILAQLLITVLIFLRGRNGIPKALPLIALGVMAIFPNLLKDLKLDNSAIPSSASNTGTTSNALEPKVDVKALAILGGLLFLGMKENKK